MLIQIFGTQLRFACALILCLFAAQPLAAQDVTGVPQIVDADTIYLNSLKIRLNGIDAPETDQFCLDARGESWTCGIEATSRLRVFSGDRLWACQIRP
jgi:endonuclease YncB( thermonuclease family)